MCERPSIQRLIILLAVLTVGLAAPACSSDSGTGDNGGGTPTTDAIGGGGGSGGVDAGQTTPDADASTPEPDSECTPNCEGKACGDDGCGGECGECTGMMECTEDGQCMAESACIPMCSDLSPCGDDGCGGSCGECGDGEVCEQVPQGPNPEVTAGHCVDETCTPECEGKSCGPDGCGNVCGACGSDSTCDEASGQCVPDAADPCDPNPCVTPPDDACEGDDVVMYDAEGACSVEGDSYSCVYGSTTMSCDEGVSCQEGSCGTAAPPAPGEFGDDVCLIDEMVIAAANEPDDCCFDFDGDGQVDNGIVDLLSSLSMFLGDVDIDVSLAEGINDGSVSIVMEAQGLDDLTDDDEVGVKGYVGYFDSEGDLLIQPGSFDDDGEPLVNFTEGTIEGGVAHMGPTDFQTSLPLAGFVLSLTIKDARGQADVSEGEAGYFDMDDGRLGGLIPFGDLIDTINLVASGCECLDLNGGDLFELKDEDSFGCGSAFDAANPSCSDADGDLCTGLASIADQKFLVCNLGVGLISPDIDTDFNGKPDHFSVGLRFSGQADEIAGMGEDQTLGGCSNCAGGGDPLSNAVFLALFAMIFALVTRRQRASAATDR